MTKPDDDLPKPPVNETMQYRGCARKVPFATRKFALESARKANHRNPGMRLSAYHCQYCGSWHTTGNHRG